VPDPNNLTPAEAEAMRIIAARTLDARRAAQDRAARPAVPPHAGGADLSAVVADVARRIPRRVTGRTPAPVPGGAPTPPKGVTPEDWAKAKALYGATEPPPLYLGAKLHERLPAWWAAAYPDHVDRFRKVAERLAVFANDYGIVALSGKRGNGKSRLAWGTVAKACTHLRSCRVVEATDFFDELGDVIFGRAGGRRKEDFVRAYSAPHLLVIDGLEEWAGPDKAEWKAETLTQIINKRYQTFKATLFTTNDSVAEFQAKVGSSISSRIQERGRAILCDWPSFRDRKGKADE
jgi:hypothetical protein